jgi:hypothetical protein
MGHRCCGRAFILFLVPSFPVFPLFCSSCRPSFGSSVPAHVSKKKKISMHGPYSPCFSIPPSQAHSSLPHQRYFLPNSLQCKIPITSSSMCLRHADELVRGCSPEPLLSFEVKYHQNRTSQYKSTNPQSPHHYLHHSPKISNQSPSYLI